MKCRTTAKIIAGCAMDFAKLGDTARALEVIESNIKRLRFNGNTGAAAAWDHADIQHLINIRDWVNRFASAKD